MKIKKKNFINIVIGGERKMRKIIIFGLSLVLFPVMTMAGSAGNTWNDSFSKAKKTLEREVYFDHRITFYCGCPFDAEKKVRPCDKYTPKNGGKRSRRIEWEHVIPAAHFGRSFKEWRDGDSKMARFK